MASDKAEGRFDPDGTIDFVLGLPDQSVTIAWQFAPGTTWPAPGDTSASGSCYLCLVLSKEAVARTPKNDAEMRALFKDIRRAYKNGTAVFMADTLPATLSKEETRRFILRLLADHVKRATLPDASAMESLQ